MKYSESTVNFRLTNKFHHTILPQEFCRRAIQVCSSNLLIAELLGVSNNTISHFRASELTKNRLVLRGQRYGICMAYNLFIDKLLEIAIETNTILNHTGYYTLAELSDKKEKKKAANNDYSKRFLNQYSEEEIEKISSAKTPNEAFISIGGEASGRNKMAVTQKFYLLKKKKVTVATSNDLIKDQNKDVNPLSSIETTILLAKKMGAKSITTVDGLKIDF